MARREEGHHGDEVVLVHVDVQAGIVEETALVLAEAVKGLALGRFEFGLDVNIGIHPYHDNLHNLGIFLMADLSARYEGPGTDTIGTTGGKRLSLGPVLVGYWNNVMLRTEAKFPVYENVFGTQVSHGIDLNVGLGVTF